MIRSKIHKKVILIINSFFLIFSLSYAYGSDAFEDDDTFEQAFIAVLNHGFQIRNFHDSGDVDWIKFYAVSGETYSVKAANPGLECDPVIELYDRDGVTLLYSRDIALQGENEILEFNCAQDGVYFARIRNYNPAVYGENTEYELSVYRPHTCLTGVFFGVVKDGVTGQLISDVRMTSDINDSALSGTNGEYRMRTCVSAQHITAAADGYETFVDTISIDYNEISNKNIELNPVILSPDISISPQHHDFGVYEVEGGGKRSKAGGRRSAKRSVIEHEYVEGQVIIKMNNQRKKREKDTIQYELGADIIQNFTNIGAELWNISGKTVEEAIAIYESHPDIDYIEPNYKLLLENVIPNDPLFFQLWGFHNTGQTGGEPDVDIDMPEAWTVKTMGDTVIAVIDTGLDYDHDDLKSNVWKNTGEIPDNQIDDDSNGFVDDVVGWNFIDDTNDPFDDHFSGHGTHCAGVIAASGNNGKGIAGVNWSAKIMPLKIFDSSGRTNIAAIVRAIEYAVKMSVDITSNSWGGGPYSTAMHDAIQKAGEAGQLFIAAAGNGGPDHIGDNNDITPHYPSNYDLPNVIAVGSITHNDSLSTFSNYGRITVDLGAPGSLIYSTLPDGQYGFMSGTSMATPHVAGAAALILSRFPELSVSEIRTCLLESVVKTPALQDRTVSGGRLNVNQAFLKAEKYYAEFTISNTGGGDLAVENISISGDDSEDFVLKNETCSNRILSPNDHCTALVSFKPLSAGKKSASLLIISDDPDTPVLYAQLSAEAVQKNLTFTLTVVKTGEGDIRAGGLECDSFPCNRDFPSGEDVLLEASPADRFLSWSGDITDMSATVSIRMDMDKTVSADFILQGWESMIQARSEFAEGVSYAEWEALGYVDILVNSYNVTIGTGLSEQTTPAPPVPPQFSVKSEIWRSDWSGPFFKDIRLNSDEPNIYKWILAINPHGNRPPPDPRTSTVEWFPESFDPNGYYRLRKSYAEDGEIIIPNMKTLTTLEVTGANAVQYFTIEYSKTPFIQAVDPIGDVDGNRIIDLRDAVIGLKINTNTDINDLLRPDYMESQIDVNGDNRVGLEEIIYILQYSAGMRE